MSAPHQNNEHQGQYTDTGPPGGRERRARDRMPDVDWLTGISSRAAFARQVGQADQDRDQFAVAIIGLRHIDEINRHLGFQVGDELLRIIGRALGDRVGVGTTVARLGGARFGMMTVGLATDEVTEWLEPVAASLNNVITGWIFEQIDFNGECLIEPKLMVGAAGGYSGRVWADAAIALDVCEAQPNSMLHGGTMIVHDNEDPRFAAIQATERLNDAVMVALDGNRIRWASQQIERCENPNPLRPWSRILPLEPGTDDRLISTAQLRPTIGSQLERRTVERAAALLANGDGQMRVTVPVSWLLRYDRGVDTWLGPIVADNRVPASRFVFEVREVDLADPTGRARSAAVAITELGAELVLAGCSGGAETVAALDALPIRYLRPDEALVTQAERGDRPAARVLDALAGIATDIGGDVIFADCRPGYQKPGTAAGFQELTATLLGQEQSQESTQSR